MRANLINAAVTTSALLLALVGAPSARGGDDPAHKLGDHPAVVVQRLNKTAGYDYASKFYPHPAWMYLYAAQPQVDAASAATADGASGSKVAPAALFVARETTSPTPGVR